VSDVVGERGGGGEGRGGIGAGIVGGREGGGRGIGRTRKEEEERKRDEFSCTCDCDEGKTWWGQEITDNTSVRWGNQKEVVYTLSACLLVVRR
jgi:hypothetical protein